MFAGFKVHLLLFILMSLWLPAHATSISEESLPEPLKPWVNWVLQDDDKRACPTLYHSNNAQCAWPSALSLDLQPDYGRFSQTWQVYHESTIRIPGSKKSWPQDVKVNGEAVVVVTKGQFPAIKLSAGKYEIEGSFFWSKMPKSLAVTPESGLINLSINNRPIAFPELRNQGELWLNNSGQSKTDIRDDLEIEVFRKVEDSHPLKVTTQIDLRVSGRQRDVELGNVLLTGFTAMQLKSSLPARIEQGNRLRVQLRPGQWSIFVTGRVSKPLTELTMPEPVGKWPKQEVWVFQARNDLRLVQIEGVRSIDPRQTRLPARWQSLPAYLMLPNQALSLKVLRRGDPDPEPDKLTLKRNLWLDFDGKGYTFRDDIRGTMTKGWRLEASPELQLGRVSVSGNPQFITRLPESEFKGVEVRRGYISLQADSRYDQHISELPISGWNHDFQSVRSTLHLPPGWKLFSVWGTDNRPNSWLLKWTLLDLFLVLIAAVAVAYLWNITWGVVALLTLGLIWHEANAPQFIWLNLLAVIALLRVLPQGLFKTMTRYYRNASVIVLLLIVLPFMVQEVRQGLYPQLEKPWMSVGDDYRLAEVDGFAQDEASFADMAAAPEPMTEMASNVQAQRNQKSNNLSLNSRSSAISKKAKPRSKQSRQVLKEVDPNATIQTGPGVPNWRWNSVTMNWNGPVEKGEQVSLVLVSPLMNMLLNFIRVLLVVVLVWRLLSHIGEKMGGGKGGQADGKSQGNAWSDLITKMIPSRSQGKAALKSVLLTLLIPIALLSTDRVHAEIPDQEMLSELKQRLLQPQDCLPDCAQIERLSIQVQPETLQALMRIHVAQKTSVPLPSSKVWMPERVLVNGEVAEALKRDKGVLWVALSKGIHDVIIQGRLPKRAQIQLSLPLVPHFTNWQGEGWNVDGIEENGRASSQLQINRIKTDDSANALEDMNVALPAFLQVERTLRLGLNWTVDTQVKRLSPMGEPVVVSVPLLPGESVLTDNMSVKDKQIRVNLAANQASIQWQSQLGISDQFTLTAAKQSHFVEVWKVEASPIWHVTLSGIPVIHHQQSGGKWLPTWMPWPGESVTLNVVRPKGVDGQTVTINASRLAITTGKRSNNTTLNISLLSSQGGQHTINLPEGAELSSVVINGSKQPVRQNGQSVTLPITPGQQNIKLEWRESGSVETFFKVSPVDLGIASVNHSINLKLSAERWVLFANGPTLGPAVLFWGVLIVILIGAFILGQTGLTPIKTWQWFLLGVGLSQSEPFMILIVVGWLLALAVRETIGQQLKGWYFNAVQIGLGVLTLIALIVLFGAVAQGLLGYPEMQIAGNSSSASHLMWFQDRADAVLPQPWVVSVPLFIYRALMLLWALWLAFAVLGWLRWGWNAMSTDGLWRESSKPKKAETASKPATQ